MTVVAMGTVSPSEGIIFKTKPAYLCRKQNRMCITIPRPVTKFLGKGSVSVTLRLLKEIT